MFKLRNFILGLFASFGAPWLILIVIPALQGHWLEPLSYNKEKDGMDGIYPGATVYLHGELVYAAEGCAQCHTQMIRPGIEGILDPWKKGWGSDQSARPADPIRPNTLRDYMGEPYAYLGIQRVGPDLANAGYRLAEHTRAEIHAHIYEPRASVPWSIMPNFSHLYKVQPIQGNGSPKALKLKAPYAPEEGYEVVPTAQAEELVNYLLSLKKDAPIPGQVVAESGSKK
jgi:cytochrome c oxidase cbb3-type subunit II